MWAVGPDTPRLGGHMHDRPPGQNPIDQDPPAVHGQSAIPVRHEDPPVRWNLDTSTAPEVIAMIRTRQR